MIYHVLPFASHKVKCHLYKLLLPFRPSGQHLTHFPSDQGSAEVVTPQQPSALCQLLLPNWTRTLWSCVMHEAAWRQSPSPSLSALPVAWLGPFFFSAQEQPFVGTCVIADCTGWFPAFTAGPSPPWSTHFSQSQGPRASLYLQGLGLPYYEDATHILFAFVTCLNGSRQLSCHLELVHFCPSTNPSHLCPGINVMCNNCITDLKNNSLGLFMNECCGYWTQKTGHSHLYLAFLPGFFALTDIFPISYYLACVYYSK